MSLPWLLEKGSQGPGDLGFEPTGAVTESLESVQKMMMYILHSPLKNLYCWQSQKNIKTLEMGDAVMRTLGNILWFICGGVLGGLAWIFAGCIWCVTIIGIPVGLQCFKFASIAFWPFGKEIVYGNGMFSFLVNLIWILFFGWEMALGNLIIGFLWCITIVGIPFGKQFFKMARLSFMPFGASVIG